MKQLGTAFLLYVQDYDERLPGAGQYQEWGNGGHWVAGTNGANADGNPGSIALVAGPDIGKARPGVSANISGGALFTYTKSEQIYICPSSPDGREKKLNYSMNCALAGAMDAAIEESSQIVLLLDEDQANDGYTYIGASSRDALVQIHNGGGNLLFADGHVKFYPFARFPLDVNDTTIKARDTGGPRFRPGVGYSLSTSSSGAFGSCAAPDVP